ncbi:MAG: vitamin K epoxide reductase family protein [Patescibacteria group bacterium]
MFIWSWHWIIVAAAAAGATIAHYIFHKKHHRAKLICPLNTNCDTVIHSEYSQLFGIGLESWGLAYYLWLLASHLVLLLWPEVSETFYSLVLIAASAGVVTFSFGLTYVQLFKIKELCTWCIASAGLCTIIFLVSLFHF